MKSFPSFNKKQGMGSKGAGSRKPSESEEVMIISDSEVTSTVPTIEENCHRFVPRISTSSLPSSTTSSSTHTSSSRAPRQAVSTSLRSDERGRQKTLPISPEISRATGDFRSVSKDYYDFTQQPPTHLTTNNPFHKTKVW